VTDSYVTAFLDNCRILMTSAKVRGEGDTLLDRKDVTDSYVTANLDNCRILMTSVKVRGGEAAGQEGCDRLLREGLPGQLQEPHDLCTR
jgi:hypothetical protein